jgi:hypothetical protein
MYTDTSEGSDLHPDTSPPTLTDRVRARVAQAERLLAKSSAGEREARSLRRVYCEMRTLYRTYRRQAGTPAVPELRSAVSDFKRGQSLASLVHIASFLDDRKLLTW